MYGLLRKVATEYRSIAHYPPKESHLVEVLQDKLKQRETDLAEMELEVKQLKATRLAVEETTTASPQKGDAATVLSEERLRWQMEKENLRKELTAKMDIQRESILKENEALKGQLKILEGASPSQVQDQVVALESSLTESKSRFVSTYTIMMDLALVHQKVLKGGEAEETKGVRIEENFYMVPTLRFSRIIRLPQK